ncbi:hypothetical protein BV22DRAFT_42001 [Leucogyrophana mollusca]|uniref:Uncharacterized protein n=1 Tax=Leucogyrophana mollusca TaxID=85980 RepID=A0ACB8BZZ6_9AGAM|nr:hypothetical protein BV22DRAFT_42001 [Leucogyrophana mollusca]
MHRSGVGHHKLAVTSVLSLQPATSCRRMVLSGSRKRSLSMAGRSPSQPHGHNVSRHLHFLSGNRHRIRSPNLSNSQTVQAFYRLLYGTFTLSRGDLRPNSHCKPCISSAGGSLESTLDLLTDTVSQAHYLGLLGETQRSSVGQFYPSRVIHLTVYAITLIGSEIRSSI